ncbi:MAG: type pilus assembly protein PilB [Thermoleophilaceae bacterium]|nr:type pilus assembly protein PilB [Thermoleophilaceae bacterium]
MSDERAHLRPVPAPGAVNEAVARVPEPAEGPHGGLVPPTRKGGGARFISDVIVELGFASADRVAAAVEEAKSSGRTPEQLLVDGGALTPEQLARSIAERFGLDFVDLSIYKTDPGALNLVSAQAAKRYHAAPIGFDDSGKRLLVAMADPSNVLALDDLKLMTGHPITRVVAAPDDLASVIARMSRLDDAVAEAIVEGEDDDDLSALTEIRESADDAPVIKLVNSLIAQAVEEGASDVHFEPMESRGMRVRYRVDGVLNETTEIPKRMNAGVVSRIKIMADLDIAERRLPQDGRVSLRVEGHGVDIRVVTIPGIWGEGIVMRLLDKEQVLLSMDTLGISGDSAERFASAVRQSYGAILVTGPTGSGKSTTLYAALNTINSPEKNIITIEDPVEYQLPGINQIQVNLKAGLGFAQGLRSMLRADPDIIMVGEIRDAETARIAVESALTGHLVLSTLHTNDAPSAITRLTEMGIEPFLTASAVDCVVAQRLARKLCTHCKKRVMLTQASLAAAGFPADLDVEAYEPAGCPRCNGSGYKGRIGIYEVMSLSDEIRAKTIERTSADVIREIAISQGMKPLRIDGLDKVKQGLTSIAEVARVA